jgi:hypothetical protein
LCFFGFVLPYSQLIPLLLYGDFSIEFIINQLFSNRVSTLFAFDLFITAVVFIVFAIYEGFKLKLKLLWIPLISTIIVGASFGFPLFLYLRELNLEKDL